MRKLTIILLASIFVVTGGCRKEIHKVNEDFIGDWYGSKGGGSLCIYHMNIDEESNGSWSKYGSYSCDFDAEGIVKLRKDKLKLDYITFEVIEHPAELDSGFYYAPADTIVNWKMIVECSSSYCSKEQISYYRE